MARVKATSSDINAKLARGECANFRNGCCQGRTPCTIVNGEACGYFSSYVLPLLDYPEVASKYFREAKITVALNPRAKVIRKRRQHAEQVLAIDVPTAKPSTSRPSEEKSRPSTKQPAPVPEKIARAEKYDQPITTVVTVSGTVRTQPMTSSTQKRTVTPKAVTAPEQPQLVLDICPSSPVTGRAKRKR